MPMRRIARVVVMLWSVLLMGQLAAAQTANPAGLVAWWPGEGNAADVTGAHNGTPFGNVTFVPGMVGSAFQFDGASGIHVPDSPALGPGNAITIEAWIRPTPGQGGFPPIIKKNGTGDNSGYALEMGGDGSLCFYVNVGGWEGVCAGITPGQWTHVAGVYDGQVLKVYTNGLLAGSLPVVGAIHLPNGNLGIGVDPTLDRLYTGLIDEPAVFNTALSAEVIQAIYSAGSLGKSVFFASDEGPFLTTPADMTVSTTNPSGQQAVVFSASAWDFVDGSISTNCSPVSGSLFTIGTTIVSCSVTNSRNASTTGAFNVTVTTSTYVGATSTAFSGSSCESGPRPCTISTRVYVEPAVSGGNVRLRSFDRLDTQLGEWASPVVDGVAVFDGIAAAPANTPPQTAKLMADYLPSSPNILASSYTRALSITPHLEATLPIAAVGPLAIDEATNRVYAAVSCNPTIAPCNVVPVFDGTHNIVLDPVVLNIGSEGAVLAVAMDSPRRKLFALVWDPGPQPFGVRVWDVDQAVVTDIIPFDLDLNGGAYFLRANPVTGLVYVMSDAGLITVNPTASEPDRVTITPYQAEPTGRTQLVPAINANENLIYLGGTIFDGSAGSAALPFTYDCCRWPNVTEVGVNRRTNSIYNVPYGVYNPAAPVGDPPAHDCYECAAEVVEILDGRKGAPTFNAVKTSAPLTPRFDHKTYSWYASALEVNSNLDRLYVSYSAGYFEYFGSGVDPLDLQGQSAVPVAVVDGTSGQKISEWWHPKPCDSATSKYESRIPSLSVNPVNGRLYLNTCGTTIAVYHDPVSEQQATETGSNVSVSVPQATITFSSVTAPGETTVQGVSVSSLDVNLPGQFELTGALAYEISTTAAVSAPIELCFNVSSITDEATFNALTVLHAEGGVWVDRTVSRNFSTGTICASTASLSPFAIARRKPYTVKPLYDTTKAFKAGSTAPIKIQIFDPTGANVASSTLQVNAVDIVQRSTNASSTVVDSGNANPDATFRHDAALGGYIYNLSAKGLPSGTYDVRFRVGADGRLYTTSIQVR